MRGVAETGRSGVTGFLVGGGKTGALVRGFDWHANVIGAAAEWPQPLKTLVGVMLGAGQPMFVAWGAQRTLLYNDGYVPMLGSRHPAALGRPFFDVWPETATALTPLFDQVFAGEPIHMDDIALMLDRGAGPREAHFSFSYTPVRDEAGQVLGLFSPCTETTEKVRAARKLAEERDRFAQLFERSPTFMALLQGPDHKIELANPGYLRLVGNRDIIGKTVAEALPDAVDQGFLALLDGVFTSGEPYAANDARYAVQSRPGAPVSERFVDFVFQPIKDEAGGVTGIFVEGADVTARATADAALRQSETRLRALNADLEHQVMERSGVGGQFWHISSDLLGVLNADGFFERSNPAWQVTLGWSVDEIAATPIFELLHPDDVAPTRAGFVYLKQGNPILQFENRYRKKSGGYVWLSWSAVPLQSSFYCSGRDITMVKEQAAALAETTAERDRVWRNSRDLLVVIGADGVFRAVNPAWTILLGHAPDDVVGRSFRDFVWPEDAATTQTALDQAARRVDLTNFENRYRHKDGTPRWISWRTSAEGDLVYAYGRDITAHKAAQAELAQAQEALRQSQKMEAVGQLTGGIAHDFNNLLAGIAGSLELLERRIAEGRLNGVDRYIGLAQASAQRAASLTQRLLAFSRRQTLDPRPTDANRLIAGMADMVRRTVGPAIEVEVVGAGGLWLTQVDPSQLENAVLNLAINARDAMPNGGRITIETANKWLDHHASRDRDVPPGQYISLCVTDTGTGMTPEVIERAFDPFFTTKPLGQGTGLGLSMIHGFVRQSGGQVRVYSELGRGTTMCLYFPRFLGALETAETPEVEKAGMAGEGETVLVIDDEAAIRMLIADVLEEGGYRVVEAADGPSGLKVLQSDMRIDLLITDVGLPGGLNGRQVADAGRALRAELKVLFITGYAENAVVGNGHLESGMHLITKPFAMSAFGARVREIIEGT